MPPNPIRQARRERNRTLEEFAQDIGVHPQALFLNEQGVYTTILPVVLDYITESDSQKAVLTTQYRAYQHEKRREQGDLFGFPQIRDLGPPDFRIHPFVSFRLERGLSKSRFAKRFCVHPASLHKLERGKAIHLPDQLVEALKEAGLPDGIVSELNSRSAEAANGGWKVAV